MKKTLNLASLSMVLAFACFSVSADAQKAFTPDFGPISGYASGNLLAPSGNEWQSPGELSLNKKAPTAYYFNFSDVESARKVLPENSSYYELLNGSWKFHWAKHPAERPQNFFEANFDASKWDDVTVPMSWNIYGIQKDGSLKYGLPIYVNQPVIFWHQVKVDDWRGGVMRTPPSNWTTYTFRNEVGSYRRNFTVPAKWDGREVFLNFDGVDSFFYVWVNGKYVGFSKNSRNLAAFDITPYLNKKGENSVSVEVYRSSDGSFLESQDMFRLPGIFRNVYLTSKAKVSFDDVVSIPDLDAQYKNGELNITANIKSYERKAVKDYQIVYSLYANKLYSDENTLVENASASASVKLINPSVNNLVSTSLKVTEPNLWSAERPYRYTLVAQLKDKKGRVVETMSVYVGFRKVEIKDTKAEDDEFGLAGRYYYINGKTIKLKGVNRHETNPAKGKVVSREQMEKEVMLMKQANINHVRNSHYPDDPYWYYLCDKYGIYLEDEANIESHEYYYGAASLSHPKEWRDAHVARNLEMVHANINHPSIVIWSLGNEAGPGHNFVEAYNALKKVDVSRPVQYERNNNIVDIGSNQYPSIEWVRGAVKGTYKLKYPFHISEYAHSMGNASGNLIDYWEAIESTNFFMGGAIWDWVDQSMYYYDKKTGERFMAYGGDFGDTPNDGTFVQNGLMLADLKPKPQYYEVRKVYQNVGVKALDITKGKIEVFNKNYFASMQDYTMQWSLYKDGVEVERSSQFIGPRMVLQARQKMIYTIPFQYEKLDPKSEYFVKVQFLLAQDMPWGKKGDVQMEEQLFVKAAAAKPSIASIQTNDKLTVKNEGNLKVVSGKGFEVKFDAQTGSIFNLVYNGNKVINDGEGPKLDALRAPADNDNWAYQQWFANGLHNLKHKAVSQKAYTRKDGAIVVAFTVESQAPNGAFLKGGNSGHFSIIEKTDKPFGDNDFKFTSNQVWTVYPDGSIELQSNISSNEPSFALARIGYSLQLPESYNNYNYYGRGPINNYADRKTAQFIELHHSTVKDQFVRWGNTQTMSNNEDIRWAALGDNQGNGLVFVSKEKMSTSALQWSELELTLAPHPYQLPKSTRTHVHLDAAVTGLGGNSCGQGPPLEQDRVKAGNHSFAFIIRPYTNNNYATQSNVSPAGDSPIIATRDKMGKVTIATDNQAAQLFYMIDGGKSQTYQAPFYLRNGGKVTVWDQNNLFSKVSFSFAKIESIPLEVVYASSQETDEGDASHLVDGDPNTIWHSMYSVTVAQYPHWVDFDAGLVKNIKGFTFLPRQSGSNGNIKEYKIQISMDGKTWGEPVVEGVFPRNARLQTVRFDKPVKGRFIRFTALSSQGGEDFASGAEFSVLAD